MTTKTRIVSLFAILCASLLGACGGPGDNANIPEAQEAGATFVDIGDHTVHFSAMTTDTLTPEVARNFNVVRSKNRAMLNVSVIRNEDRKPVEATVSLKTVNLTGQLKNVSVRKVTEGNPETDEFIAIYYIGDTTVANRETLMFDIDVQPEGVETASRVRFQREFYTD